MLGRHRHVLGLAAGPTILGRWTVAEKSWTHWSFLVQNRSMEAPASPWRLRQFAKTFVWRLVRHTNAGVGRDREYEAGDRIQSD